MKNEFDVWMIVRDGEFIKCPWNPQPPMIFSTEQAAKDHCCENPDDKVVFGKMTFETI